MSEKLFFYDVPVLEVYFDLLDELIKEQAAHEWNVHLMKNLPPPKKLSTFKLCNPFWLTYFILKGIFQFVFSPNNKQVVVVKTEPIKYRDLDNFSDDDSDDSEDSEPLSTQSKGTQTDRRDLDQIGVENALTDLITMRKFKEIVPANRRAVKKMASNMTTFRRIDQRNRNRFGGKVVKSKLKANGSKIFSRPKISDMETDTNKMLSVHEVLNHLLYVESSDDENSV